MPGSANISWLRVPLSGIQEVQNKSYGSAADATGHTITLNTTPVAGNLLILCVNADYDIPTPPSGWTLVVKPAAFCIAAMYYKVAGASEPTSITVTQDTSSSMCLYVMEYSGMAASPFDTNASVSLEGSPISTGTTPTTAQADELLVAMAAFAPDIDTSVSSWSNSFVEKVEVVPTAGTALRLVVASRIVSATGAYSTEATAVNAANLQHIGLIAAFKKAA